MSAEQQPRDVWSDLVGGLLDARSSAVTARFDAELTAAVEAGRLSEETAHRLRFWQRASVRAVADHVRSVMPVALGALEAARTDAVRYADEAAAVLGPFARPPAADAEDPVDGQPEPQPPQRAEQRSSNGWHVHNADERRASTHAAPEPSSLGAPSFVILADLTQAESRT